QTGARGHSSFRARLNGESPGALDALLPGSELEVTGLVQLEFATAERDDRISKMTPNHLDLILRSAADVVVLQQPSWWTVRRLLGMMGSTIALALAFALWNYFLRARAKTQQEIISAQARREATSDERTRFARELHDSLEQEFVGMTRQTEALEHAGPLTPQARANLEVLRQMLGLSRDNARRVVWDLRDPALLDDGLEAAIRTALQRIVSGKPMVVNLLAEMDPAADIPPQVQVNVLRLAQEAVTNAVKHADARTIEVRLTHHDHTLVLTVTDDGHAEVTGGTPPTASAGHFGILGMQERCDKLGGRFEFHSRPGGGSSVQATIPV
ncbi:MAG: sensor histidine kinase, partial [Verrucomicrobiota bacterium]